MKLFQEFTGRDCGCRFTRARSHRIMLGVMLTLLMPGMAYNLCFAGLAQTNKKIHSAVLDFETMADGAFVDQSTGWTQFPGSGAAMVVTDNSVANGTQVIRPVPTRALSPPIRLSLQSGPDFSIHAFSPLETSAYIQADMTAHHTVLMGLGHNLDNAELPGDTPSERSVNFGISNGQFVVNTPANQLDYSTAMGPGYAAHHWYRLRLAINLAADNGAGLASLYVMNLSAGDSKFKPVEGLQNLELGHDALAPNAKPEHWDSVWIFMQASGMRLPAIDNLIPHSNNQS